MASRRRTSRKKKRSGAASGFVVVFLLLLVAAGIAAWAVFIPYGPDRVILIQIEPGASTLRIGRQLQTAGIVRNQYAFDLLRFAKRGVLRAGEYRFDHPAPMIEVYDRIARGDVYTVSLTVPEGANIFDIATRVQQAGLCSREAFLHAAVSQASLLADLDPNAKSVEGYLFPDTYKFSPPVSAEQIISVMVRQFRAEAAELGLKNGKPQENASSGPAPGNRKDGSSSPVTENVHDIVTLASLVERETAVNSERPLVASVFENRLAKNMPLMCDPSVIYGLEKEGRWRGAIYRSDLKNDTPYNIYLHTGLPPGPIDNPGIPSLRAALHPAHTDYLYFVAAGSNPQGHSLFAATLDQQDRNVADYRKATKRAGAQ